jgi:hypothetical protein
MKKLEKVSRTRLKNALAEATNGKAVKRLSGGC